jgi:hypothetical protein
MTITQLDIAIYGCDQAAVGLMVLCKYRIYQSPEGLTGHSSNTVRNTFLKTKTTCSLNFEYIPRYILLKSNMTTASPPLDLNNVQGDIL